ncbi:MAG: hypothetical protein NW214_05965 [Pseudanabaenaceae cyanobacterium bins.39]|nr:hypothetical protein [Pseudanabaenaceae cyanobacterium bins.39]
MEIAIALLQRYSFDLGGYTINLLRKAWSAYREEWVRQAVIEALFQGRYKAVSVNQILQTWERKGESRYHYNRDFERLVCGDVAVIYEDRIFYTAPRQSLGQSRENSHVQGIEPFQPSDPSSTKPTATKSTNSINSKLLTMAGTTSSQSLSAYSDSRNGYVNESVYNVGDRIPQSSTYQTAYAHMTLLNEKSIFVDKLRSMCSDRAERPELNQVIAL